MFYFIWHRAGGRSKHLKGTLVIDCPCTYPCFCSLFYILDTNRRGASTLPQPSSAGPVWQVNVCLSDNYVTFKKVRKWWRQVAPKIYHVINYVTISTRGTFFPGNRSLWTARCQILIKLVFTLVELNCIRYSIIGYKLIEIT